MAGTVDFAGGYRFIPACFNIRAGSPHPGHTSSASASASRCRCGGVRADRAPDPGGRAAAHLVLRLRAALAGAVHRAGLSSLQRDLRRHAREMGTVRRQDESGRAQQRVSGDRSAGRSRRSTPSHSPSAATHPAPSFVIAGSAEAREGGASYRERTVRHGETSPDAMREKARYVLGEMERRLAASSFAGPTPRPRRSTRCTTSIHSWRMRSSGAAPPDPA